MTNHGDRSRAFRVAILGNCQAPLWADALLSLSPNIDVTSHEHVGTRGRTLRESYEAAVSDEPHVVLLLPEFLRDIRASEWLASVGEADFVTTPGIAFTGFHPDLSYAFNSAGLIPNALGEHWNSKILVWCFLHDVPVADTLELFTAEAFEALGYFDTWRLSASALEAQFRDANLDFRSWMMTVKRSGIFMHGINHPKPIAIAALAQQVLSQHLQQRPLDLESALGYLPDRLGSNVIWPVHGAIASQLSVAPMERLKVHDTFIEWRDFAEDCYHYWTTLNLTPGDSYYIPALDAEQESTMVMLTGVE
jgi:hypothetical protein